MVKEEIHGLERDVTWFVEMAMLVVERERERMNLLFVVLWRVWLMHAVWIFTRILYICKKVGEAAKVGEWIKFGMTK